MTRFKPRFSTAVHAVALTLLLVAAASFAAHAQAPIPSIADKTAGMQKIDGFFPLYWDPDAGQLLMEIDKLDTEVLNITGMGAGLGSNDIGIDRGQLTGYAIVKFK